jgi:SAM-dependent methyltransferase
MIGPDRIGRSADAWAWGDNERPEVLAHVPVDVSAALDVGCAFGTFGSALKAARDSAVVYGIEPSALAATAARGKLDAVVEGFFPQDVPPTWHGFDLVCFNDSLEHMTDPWAALAAAVELVRPGGTVIASIPNVRFLDVSINLLARGRWPYQDDGVLDRTHLRFFTRSTMVELFATAGLVPHTVQPLHVEDGATHLTARILRTFGPLFTELLAPQYLLAAKLPG